MSAELCTDLIRIDDDARDEQLAIAARAGWTWDGSRRPPFADIPKPGQESVWDYPRPPRIANDNRHVRVRDGTRVIADTQRAIRVLETAGAPTFYVPPGDVDLSRLRKAPGQSACEWKGRAAYWSVARGAAGGDGLAVDDLAEDGEPPLDGAVWSYPTPRAAFAAIAGWFAFHPAALACEIDGERVRPQPGGFYGGWVTDEIAGPVKGAPGSGNW